MEKLKRDNFYRKLATLAVPIILQSLIASSLNLVDNLMIGQLGEVSIAAVGLANQVYFLVSLIIIGISSGSAIFFSQYWGKKDIRSINKTMGVALTLSLIVSAVFTIVAVLSPEFLISIYSKDNRVVVEGGIYLSIAAWTYMPFAISLVFVAVLRSTGRVKLPLLTSSIALGLNTFLNYGLIFGNLGMPELGVVGAAIATLIARLFELILILGITYLGKYDIGARIKELFSFSFVFMKTLMKRIWFVIFSNGIWALGTTCYSLIYARMGTNEIVAMNITGTLAALSMLFAMGIGNGLAIMIGNNLGANKFEQAKRYAHKGIVASLICGIVVALIVLLVRDGLLSLYNIESDVLVNAKKVTNILIILLPQFCVEFLIYIGILRAGGDNRFCTLIDMISLWGVGLPLALVGAFVLHLPLPFVYLLAKSESLVRLIISYLRYKREKWVNNVI